MGWVVGGGGRGEDWEWCVWCWDSVGKSCGYTNTPLLHLSPPNPIQHQVFPTYPDRIRTARHTPLSPPSPNSHPQYLSYIHPTQPHSRSNSTSTNPIQPYPQSSVHYPTPRHILPLPTRPTPTPQPNQSAPI